MKESSSETKAGVSFRDKHNEVVYKKILSFKTTIFDILEIQSRMKDSSALSIEIGFSGINFLNQIYLMQTEQNELNLNYHFGIDEISEILRHKEGVRDRLIKDFYSEIWLRDKRIMDILDSDELFLEWGGPQADYSPNEISDLNVNYYADRSCAWLLFLSRRNKTDKCETITLESIRMNALNLSVITKEILDSLKKI